ncbi:MAG TPA: MEDS domain-containing protein, partial [Halanaerobiales bacterium]|nr:MEDS domain-containing protein [Halanaerobiales bacterium]
MENKYHKIDNLDKLQPGDHTVLIYEKEEDTHSSLVSFIRASLLRGEKCFYIEGDTNTEFLIKTLKKNMENFTQYIDSSQVQFLTKEETYALSKEFKADKMIKMIKDLTETALEEGYTGLSITGELSWVLNFEGGKEEIIEYEWKLNERVFNEYPVVALCRYNLNKFDQDIIKAVLELHDYIIWQDRIHENPYYIEPDGYKNNDVVDYEIKAWLENIQKYKKRESVFKERLEEKESEYEFLFNQISDA